MIYLLKFNITYIIIFATCFDSYESSSGINFQELLCILFYGFYVLLVRHKICKTICTIVLEIYALI